MWRSAARQGAIWPGTVRPGVVRRDEARIGTVGRGQVWRGVARSCGAGRGPARQGSVRLGVARHGFHELQRLYRFPRLAGQTHGSYRVGRTPLPVVRRRRHALSLGGASPPIQLRQNSKRIHRRRPDNGLYPLPRSNYQRNSRRSVWSAGVAASNLYHQQHRDAKGYYPWLGKP